MKWFVSQEVLKSDFLSEVEKISGVTLSHCYQCGKCSAGCPISYEMDYLPNQIIRLIQLGMKDEVLKSKTMWLCVSCITCTTRCPREIDIAEIMDSLRRMAYRYKYKSAERGISIFNKIFVANIQMFGRLYEFGLIGAYNLLSFKFFKDVMLGPQMFFKGKLSLFPHFIKEIGKISKRSKEIADIK